MIQRAYRDGVLAASKRFGVREASVMDLLLSLGGPMVAKAGINTLAPKLIPGIEKSLEAPFQAAKNMGGGLVRSMRGQSTPAEAFARQLSSSQIPGAVEHAAVAQRAPVPHIEHMLPPRSSQ